MCRYMTYHERQKPASRGQKSPEKKDGDKYQNMASAFTQSNLRSADEEAEMENVIDTRDFKSVTGLGNRLSDKLRLQAEAMKAEIGEDQGSLIKNEACDMFAA